MTCLPKKEAKKVRPLKKKSPCVKFIFEKKRRSLTCISASYGAIFERNTSYSRNFYVDDSADRTGLKFKLKRFLNCVGNENSDRGAQPRPAWFRWTARQIGAQTAWRSGRRFSATWDDIGYMSHGIHTHFRFLIIKIGTFCSKFDTTKHTKIPYPV